VYPRLVRHLLLLVTVAVVSSLFVFPQAQTAGSISGVVSDATGGVIPGAEVVITNQDTGARRTVISDDTGFYTAPNVPVGTYSVSVAMPGFSTATARDIKVDVRGNPVVNLRLQIGDVAEEVIVEGASMAQVELRSGEVGNLITGEQVTELPLNNRSFVSLSLLVPGASMAQDANVRNTGLFAGVDISFSGSASNANMWLVDGTNNVDIGSGRTILTYPSVDSIAEFKIQRNSYSADMGASSGAQINVVTKSGTNEFHGSIYQFHRNSALNATDFFLNSFGQEKQPLVYNNFGYTIGGPILRDRAFFFWSHEFRRERRGVPRTALVPTMAERQGDFSGVNTRNYPDPIDWETGQPFPNNQLPAGRMSPAGMAWMDLYPVPTVPFTSPTQAFNWVAAPSTPINTRQEQFRADWNITDQHSVMGRFTKDSWTNNSPSFVEAGLWGDDPFPPVDSNWNQPAQNFTSQWTATFGPATVNQVSFSWAGNEIRVDRGQGEAINRAVTSAIPEVFPGPEDRGHAVFWGDPMGNSLWHQAPWQNQQDLFIWKDDFSRVMGEHSLKLGFLFSTNSKDEDIDNNSAAYSPQFWSDGGKAIAGSSAAAGGWGDPEAPGRDGIVTGNGLADMLLQGTFWGSGTESNTNPRSRVRWRDYETYFADTWRVQPRLTLNYGFRWAYLPNPWDAGDANFPQGAIGNFVLALYDPEEGATSTNGMIYPGNTRGMDVDDRSLVKNYRWDIAPRLGIAWDPTGQGRWALRAGAGIFYNREAISDVLFMSINPPFRTTINWIETRPLDFLPGEPRFSGGEGVAQRGKVLDAKTPGSYQWNLTVERELWRDTKLEVGYVANRGHHIPGFFDLNQVPVEFRTQYAIATLDGDPATSGDQFFPLQPLIGTSIQGLRIASRGFDSWYHSLQTYLVKRFSRNFSYQMSYTWSKLLATGYGLGHIGGNVVSDPQNIRYDKGFAQFDRPHMFTGNLIYRTPGLEGSGALTRYLLGGWETAIIYTANSGRMERITCCTNYTGTSSNRPDLVADPEGPQTVDQWFNVGAFRPPDVVGRLGRSAPAQYRGPGINNWDMSFMKNFDGLPWFTDEGATLQFRAEMFNTFNKTQFLTVNNSYDFSETTIDPATGEVLSFVIANPNVGRITRMREPREIQFAFKILW
jgi:hypothetical protein